VSFCIIVVLSGDTLEYLQRFLQSIKYIILGFTPSTAFFHLLLPRFLEPFLQVSFFAFTYVCIHYLYHIHPPTPFPVSW
jgi:hypothetical protein